MLHGKDELALKDVQGIGESIGVKFNGDKTNMFNVLSRVGRKPSRSEREKEGYVGGRWGCVWAVRGGWVQWRSYLGMWGGWEFGEKKEGSEVGGWKAAFDLLYLKGGDC